MTALLDGLSVLADHWSLVAVVLVCALASQYLVASALRAGFGDALTPAEYFSLGVAGWIAPVLILSLFWNVGGYIGLTLIGLSAAALLPLLFRFGPRPKPAPGSTSLILSLFLFLFVLLRLAYISRAILPLYFDSATHYSVVENILAHGGSWLFDWLSANYYHAGFHFQTAFFASVSRAEVAAAMLVFGQIFLALVPFSVFFPVRHETNSKWAGVFAIVLSAFGWYMPAHAVNWGKYPALTSLGPILFVLGLAYLFARRRDIISARGRWMLYGLLGMGAFTAVLTHSRSLVVLAIVLLAWVIATRLEKSSRTWMSFAFVVVVAATSLEYFFIQRREVLALVFDPYLHKGIPITALVLLLSIFAWMVYPRLTFVSVLAITLLLGSLFVPVTWIPGYRDLTLLDRPFVEMILFLPLSLLGGLGLAGLEGKLRGRFAWGKYVGLLAVGGVAIHAFFTYNLYPSGCCAIAGNDDVVAMAWVEEQLPVQARIGIASTALKVMPFESSEGEVGADAGVWIAPLTNRVTVLLPNDLDFDQRPALERLCELEIGYLFVGEIGQPFDAHKILSRPEWYKPLLSMPKTWIFEVIGCDN